MVGRPRGRPRRAKLPNVSSEYEEWLAVQLTDAGIKGWVRQLPFAHPRKYLADFAWPNEKLIVEVQGGEWMGKGHTGGAGYRSDCSRLNIATLLGWKMLWFTPTMLEEEPVIEFIREVLQTTK